MKKTIKEIYEDIANYYSAGHSVDSTLEYAEQTYGEFFKTRDYLLEGFHDFLDELFD
jgi:hypothetical protein